MLQLCSGFKKHSPFSTEEEHGLHPSRVGSPGNLFFNHESFWLTASCFFFRYWKLERPVEENLLWSFCSCQHFLWTTHHLSAIVSLNRGDRHGSERSEEVESVPEDRRVLHKHNNVVDENQNWPVAGTCRTNMSLSKKMPASTSGSISWKYKHYSVIGWIGIGTLQYFEGGD